MLLVEIAEKADQWRARLESAVRAAARLIRARGIRRIDLANVFPILRRMEPSLVGVNLPEGDVVRILQDIPGIEVQGRSVVLGSTGEERDAGRNPLDLPGR